MKTIKNTIKSLKIYLNNKKYKIFYCSESPSNLKKNTIYLIGLNENIWEADMLCPCGCGDILQINFDNQASHHWRCTINKKSITVYPSVWRTIGCESHFSIINSRIVWHESNKQQNSSKQTYHI